MRGFVCLLIAIWWLSPACSVLADVGDGAAQRISPRPVDHASKSGKPSERSGNKSAGWTTTAGALAVVVVLILVLSKVFRQRGLLAPVSLPREAVHVLGRTLVDYRNTIHLVQCGSRLLVLGSSQTGLTTLAEITDPAEVDHLSGLCKATDPLPLADSFGELIRRFRTEPTNATPPERDADPTVLRLRERLATVQGVNENVADFSSIREGAG